ncbi:hypothetical protein [Eubacterium sp.]|uniref:hypothetical protein n=1 Tax=Eubacterium sp. TaxID=142586 RepID=UPI002FC722AD
MDFYSNFESIKSYVGGDFTDADINEYACAAKEMIDQYCKRNGLIISDPPPRIVTTVNKELAKVMISERFTTSESVGEESYSYRDDKYEIILRKLNFLPGMVEESSTTGSTKVSARLI